MAELKPTPARLDLLRAVEAGQVAYSTASGNDFDRSRRPERMVNDRVRAMSDAGWIRLRHEDEDTRWSRFWELTDTGRAVLAAADTPKEQP